MSWEQTLEKQKQQPAVLSDSSTPAITILDNWRVIQVTGDDAADYLQNLLTNDLRQLAVGEGQLTGFCNPKGRLLAVFFLLRREQGFALIMPTDIVESIQKKLTMFVLRSKVQINSDSSNAEAILGLFTTDQSTEIAPKQDFATTEQAGICRVKIPGTPTRMMVITDKDNALHLLQDKLSDGWQHCNEAAWQLADINAELPIIVTATQESFTPQQINLDLLNGVSFKKGCYPGQEVVARLHYLGSPSRRLFSAELDSNTPPQPGQNVIDSEGNVQGQVVQAQLANNSMVKMLVTMKLAATAHTGNINGKKITNIKALALDTE